MKKTRKLSSVLFLISIVFFSFFVMPGCKKDPDTFFEKYALYKLLCPAGLQACYGNCGVTYDTDGNGIIDPTELPAFNRCTSTCDANCNTSFIYLLFE